MTTGARRGELCALGANRIEFEAGVIDIRHSIGQLGKRVWQKDTKTHQRRRIVVDPAHVGSAPGVPAAPHNDGRRARD